MLLVAKGEAVLERENAPDQSPRTPRSRADRQRRAVCGAFDQPGFANFPHCAPKSVPAPSLGEKDASQLGLE